MKKGLYILFFLQILPAKAQEPLYKNEYYLNSFLINPAATGIENFRVVNATYKRQWHDVKDAPGIQMISISNRIGNYDFYNPKMMLNKSNVVTKNRVGLGASIFNDHNGPLSYQGVYLSYAYHIPFRFSRLSFGLSGSITQHLLDESGFEPYQKNDPVISYGKENFYFPNTSFGVVYHNHRYYAGISVNQIINLNNSFSKLYKSKNDYYLIGGYKFHDIKMFDFETSAMVEFQDYEKLNYDVHFRAYVYEFYWMSVSYRSYKAMDFQLGIKLIRNIFIAYGFEANLGEVLNYYAGTHQVNIGVNIGLRAVQGVRTYVKE